MTGTAPRNIGWPAGCWGVDVTRKAADDSATEVVAYHVS